MGAAKSLLEEREAKHRVATSVAIAAGALSKCEVHEYVLDIGGDAEEAQMFADSLMEEGDDKVAIFKGDRDELQKYISEVMNDYGEECPGCAAAMKD